MVCMWFVCGNFDAFPYTNELNTNNMKHTCRTQTQLPNANHIPLACVGARVGHYRLALGIINLYWACIGGSRWVREAFLTPTC